MSTNGHRQALGLLLCKFYTQQENIVALIPYVEGGIIGIPKSSPTGQNPPIFINSYTGDGTVAHPPGMWSTVDVSSIVPPDATAIHLTGFLIITHGTTVETADLTVAFRHTSETWEYGYIMQTVEASVQNGQRSNASAWVALDANRCFQMKWSRSTQGQWPDHASYGVNLSLDAYLRTGTNGGTTDLTAVNQQIAALQASVVGIQQSMPDMSTTNAAIMALQSAVSVLQQATPTTPDMSVINGEIDELQAAVAALEQGVSANDPRVTQIITMLKALLA